MRKCCKCDKEKELEEFAKHKKMKGGRDTVCKVCASIRAKKHYKENKERKLLLAKEYYENNKEDKIEYARKQRKDLKNFKEENRKGKVCKCGFDKWQILIFHHRDREDKKFGLARRNSASIKLAQKEIDKCDLLCPNCHREIEYFIEQDKMKPIDEVSQTTRYRYKKKEWYNKIKEEAGCKECGEKRFWVLDAHHREPHEEKDYLFRMVHNRASNEKILAELEKCDLLCSNCHQWLTHLERRGKNV